MRLVELLLFAADKIRQSPLPRLGRRPVIVSMCFVLGTDSCVSTFLIDGGGLEERHAILRKLSLV